MRIKSLTPQDSQIDWLGFKGLDIQPDVLSRPFDSWRRIENCDLFVPGAIRKIVGPVFLGGPYVSKTPPPLPPVQVVNEEIVYNYTSVGIDTLFAPPVPIPVLQTVLLPADIQPGDILIALVVTDALLNHTADPIDVPSGWTLITASGLSPHGHFSLLWHTVDGTEGPTVTFSYSGSPNVSGIAINTTIVPVRYADPVNPVTVSVSHTGVNSSPTQLTGPVTTIANTLIFAFMYSSDNNTTVGDIDGTTTIFQQQADPSLIPNTAILGQKSFVGPGATGNFISHTGWGPPPTNNGIFIFAVNPPPAVVPVPPSPTVIVEMAAYKQTPTTPFIDIGVGADGSLYDLITAAFLASLGGDPGQPFVCTFPGTAFGGAAILYLLSTLKGAPPVKYDGVSVTPIGVSEPIDSVQVAFVQSANHKHAYFMQVGIQYLWTYFNSNTFHESSPSPVTDTSIITPINNTPDPATPYIRQVQLTINTPNPPIGSGYNKIRVYRTRDGGATFFLLPTLYDINGNIISDSNDSVARSTPVTVVYDGVTSKNIAPTDDALLVNPPGGAPAIGANNPPPVAVWGAVYQSRYWLVKEDLKTLVFSNIGDFQSFGVDSFFNFSKDILDEITALVALSDRLIVNGKNTARQITGTDFTSFVEVPVDMRRGSVGRRTAASDGDNIYVLTAQSLARLAFSPAGPPFIGDHIKPYTDALLPVGFQTIDNMDIDTRRSILVFAVRTPNFQLEPPNLYCDQIILADLGRESPFTLITGLPTGVITVRELEFADGSLDMVFSGVDGLTYRLYDSAGGPGSLVATLETQQLPLVDLFNWKVWQHILITGTDLPDWKIAYSTDGVNFFPLRQMFGKNLIGLAGQQIVIKFVHNVNNGQYAVLSRATLKYEEKMGAR